jgi:hypothetical protein
MTTRLVTEPLAWAHWRAEHQRLPELGALEIGCYMDTRPTGALTSGLGPLKVLNTAPGGVQMGRPRMAIVIRVSLHDQPQDGQVSWARTNVARYTGADLGDEVGALLSLALGCRCRSGGLIRSFEPKADVRGEPTEWAHVQPYLPPPRYEGAPILPLASEVPLEDARPYLERYPYASQRKAVALVRAARLYEQALWVVEADPELSWLLLVTAIEAAALQNAGPIPRGQTRHAVGPTGRFVNFVRDFAPPRPPKRPQYNELDWGLMAQHARTIYHWRSRALHDGIPFPPPMYEPPRPDASGVLPEVPAGYATSRGSTVWSSEDTPMLLSTFAYIARGALLRWWSRTPRR